MAKGDIPNTNNQATSFSSGSNQTMSPTGNFPSIAMQGMNGMGSYPQGPQLRQPFMTNTGPIGFNRPSFGQGFGSMGPSGNILQLLQQMQMRGQQQPMNGMMRGTGNPMQSMMRPGMFNGMGNGMQSPNQPSSSSGTMNTDGAARNPMNA